MAKAKTAAPAKKKGSKAIVVFNVLFIIALVIGIAAGVLMFVPACSKWVKDLLSNQQWAVNFVPKLTDWVKVHIADNFGFNFPFRDRSDSFSACLYLFAYAALVYVLLVAVYLPFVCMNRNRKKGKTQGYRKFFCWLAFIIALLYLIGFVSILWKDEITAKLAFYDYLPTYYGKWVDLFRDGGALRIIVLEGISTNVWFNATFFALVILFIVEFIFFFIARVGKAKKAVEVSDGNEEVENKEAPVAVEATPAPAAAAMAATASVAKANEEKVSPTVRELALLNSLEPVNPEAVANLPGLYETDVDKLIDLLEPETDEMLENEEQNAEDALAAEETAEELTDENAPVDVLPGIDETGEDPFAEEKPVEEDITEVAAPTTEETPALEEVEEEKTEPVTVAENNVDDEGKRPQEEEHEAEEEEEKTDRSEKLVNNNDNSHEEVKTQEFTPANDWKLPDYVEEEKKEEAPVEEKPAEEEKKEEPAKPVANVKQVELKAPINKGNENKPKISPIAPVAPMKQEETPVEEKEEKTLAPISGPLHSTEKSKHEKIEVVEAKKVKFELQNYQIKTYDGDLTAEEAFAKGVTKVQPTVNPVFANQNDEPEWKKKRHAEEIKKNGYGNVTKVDKLNGAKTETKNQAAKSGSIRDLVKASKANNEKTEEAPAKEENKIQKPTAPIAFKPVEPAKKEEAPAEEKNENPFSETKTPAFHPIAPIAKKNGGNRPTIKPVDPMKKKQ